MEVLGLVQLIGRRRGEYPLVQDTVTDLNQSKGLFDSQDTENTGMGKV